MTPSFSVNTKRSIWTSVKCPEGEYLIPFGQARTVVAGSDITIVAMSRMVVIAEQAAAQLKEKGISAEVIDLRTLSPLDEGAVLESLAKTGTPRGGR